MIIGLDIGYSHTKATNGRNLLRFPSVVGSPERGRFALNGSDSHIFVDIPGDGLRAVGEGAIRQSRFLSRREDRKWIESQQYRVLLLAALTGLTTATSPELTIITGLPVAYYDDRDSLRDRLLGDHRASREGNRAQLFRVTDCRVIPQPFGAILSMAMDQNGRIVDEALVGGQVGVIDIGGKTTNLLAVDKMAEVGIETTSVDTGAWDVVRVLRDFMARNYADRGEIRDHQIVDAIRAKGFRYFGQWIDISSAIQDALQPMAEVIVSQASQLWNGGGGLDAILISGGGAVLFGDRLTAHFRHARIVDDPVHANALGYYRFGQWLNRQK